MTASLPIPADELDALRARYPAGFESSLVMPCLRRIQELRGHVEDADIGALATYLGVPRVQIEEVPLTLSIRDGVVTLSRDPAGKSTRVVTRVDSDAFDEAWLHAVGRAGRSRAGAAHGVTDVP